MGRGTGAVNSRARPGFSACTGSRKVHHVLPRLGLARHPTLRDPRQRLAWARLEQRSCALGLARQIVTRVGDRLCKKNRTYSCSSRMDSNRPVRNPDSPAQSLHPRIGALPRQSRLLDDKWYDAPPSVLFEQLTRNTRAGIVTVGIPGGNDLRNIAVPIVWDCVGPSMPGQNQGSPVVCVIFPGRMQDAGIG